MVAISVGTTEEWRPVAGTNGLYEVSSLGRVRSWNRSRRRRDDRGPWLLALSFTKQGYLRTSLGSFRRDIVVHRLVIEAFVGPCTDGCEVNHKDGVKTNNRPENLEYTTRAGNCQHMWAMGLGRNGDPRGERNGRAKLTVENVRFIREHPEIGGPTLARMFGVSHPAIYRVRNGKGWVVKDV